jgi:hypothetical protein
LRYVDPAEAELAAARWRPFLVDLASHPLAFALGLGEIARSVTAHARNDRVQLSLRASGGRVAALLAMAQAFLAPADSSTIPVPPPAPRPSAPEQPSP